MSDFVQEEEEAAEEISFIEKIKSLRILWIILVALIIAGTISGIILYAKFGQFGTYSIREEIDLEGGSQSRFKEFANGLLAYSKDGASYRTYRGELVWSETYDMQSPTAVVCGDELLIYDKSGTRLTVLTKSGSQGEISTTLPIVRADIAKNGMIAVLMQDQETGYLNVYESDGGLVAGGQVHLEKSGYPIAIAISPDGSRLAVSLICISDGTSFSQITFYDFSKTGSKSKDNIIASFNYVGSVFPELQFMGDGRLVGYSSKEIMVFSNSKSKPEAERRISVSKEIRSVVTGDDMFGVITKSDEGDDLVSVYTSSGRRKYEKTFQLDYNRCEILSNGDFLVTDGEEVIVLNKYGTKHFVHRFSDGILALFPDGGLKNYIIIEKGKLTRIVLK